MAEAYATTGELTAWLGEGGASPSDAERLLSRASDVLDSIVTAAYVVDADTELPTDADTAAALRDACCAQVEFWMEVGEENDIDGLAGTQLSTSGYSGRRAPRYSPRAIDILKRAWLL